MRNRQPDPISGILLQSFWFTLLVGLSFVGFAFLILKFPELLAIPVSFVLFFVGAYLLRAAWRVWRARRESKSLIEKFFDF